MTFTRTLIASVALLAAGSAHAWENTKAHPTINQRAFDYFVANYAKAAKYQRSPIDTAIILSGPAITAPGSFNVTTGTEARTIPIWLAHGGYSADEPEVVMSLRHFFDPLAKTQYYLTDIIGDTAITNPAIDARTWALEGPASGAYPENEFSWAKGLAYLRLALEKETGREENLARAFRALGETMHLLADMTQPAHVRNDGHPYSEPIEDGVGKTIIESVDVGGSTGVTLTVNVPELLFLNVATFTNASFYSHDTIADAAAGVKPQNEKPAYDNPSFSDFTYANGIVSRGSDRMLEQTLTGYLFGTNAPMPFHIPMAYAADYARELIPLAVQADARLIDLFLPDLALALTVHEGKDATTLDAQFTHTLDSVWKQPIAYSGPGTVYKNGGAQVATVTFAAGLATTTMTALAKGDVVYVEVKAGGRIFRSPEVTIQGPAAESLLSRWQARTGGMFEFTGRLVYDNGDVQSTDPPGMTFVYMSMFGESITWSGATFSSSKTTTTGPMSMPGDRTYTLVETHSLTGTMSADGRTMLTVRAENSKKGTSVYLDGHSEVSTDRVLLEGKDLPLVGETSGSFSVSSDVRSHVVHLEAVDSILKRSSIDNAQWTGATLTFSFQ
jgi:hypothetical protein